MRNHNQILHGDQATCEEYFKGRPALQ